MGASDFDEQEAAFEGMATTLPSRSERYDLKQKMEIELPTLQQAMLQAQRMRGTPEHNSFSAATYASQKAEQHHALAHYAGNTSNPEEYAQQSQQGRKAVKQSNELFQAIPPDRLTQEHSRFAYNLNVKAQHLCDRHGQHIPRDSRSQEICGAIKVEDIPHNATTIKSFSSFDPSFGLEIDPSTVKVQL